LSCGHFTTFVGACGSIWRRAGEDLLAAVFQQVTDAQLEAVGAKAEWQRIDSTQVMSNVAQQSRLELIIAVVQQV